MAPSNIIFDDIKDSHRQEWLDSAVDESLIDANLHTISDHRTINHLLGWKTPKGAAGKQGKEDRTCWATWGINPQSRESVYFGVQVKPDNPRNNGEGKPIKYESGMGKGEASQPLFLKVPDPIWEKIAAKWSVPILAEDFENGFWPWVLAKPQIPILITEGAKKAASLLSHGFVCLSVAGVSNGQYLGDVNPHIKPFCQVGRKVALAYDSDLHFKASVRKELDRLGRLLATAGAVPYVMLWDEATKGIDDVISEFGASELDKIYSTAKTFEAYRREDFEIDGKKKEAEQEIETDDNFNQIAIAAIYKNQRYICLNKELYRFNGTHYELSPDSTEMRRITKFCNTYKFYDGKTRRYSHRYATETSVANVLKWLKATTGVTSKEVNPNALNLANGILYIDWDKNTPSFVLKPHHPDILFTYVSNVKYDPQADPHHCDRLLSALIPAQREIVLRTLAASLSFTEVRARLPNRLRCLLMQGSGSNGKDTLRDAVTDVMGGVFVSNCSLSDFHSFEKGSDKFALAPLASCKLNWSPENTDSLLLDKLETLKAVITGDPIRVRDLYEKAETVSAQFALLFNVNRMPAISASQVAIKSRLAIITFTKTFKSNPDPDDPNQLKGDHRYKNDPKFRQENICSSLLNRLLQSLSDVVNHGIDYSSCEEALQKARESSCHLTRWAKDITLTEGKGRIRIGDLFNNLKNWYVDNGILELEESPTGKERLLWLDDGEKYDPFIKAPNRMRKAIEKIFPNASFSEKTEYGFFAIGINSPLFTVLPNFYSSGSAKEENTVTVNVSTAEPNPEPNNSASGFGFGSADQLKETIKDIALRYQSEGSYPTKDLFTAISLVESGKIAEAKALITPDLKAFTYHSQHSKDASNAITKLFDALLAEPNLVLPEPDSTFAEHNISGSASETIAMNGFIPSAEPTEPKTGKTVKNKKSYAVEPSQDLKIGDRVDILRYKSMCEKFPKFKPYPPDRDYQVTELAENNGILQVTIKHPSIRASFVVNADWVMDSPVTA